MVIKHGNGTAVLIPKPTTKCLIGVKIRFIYYVDILIHGPSVVHSGSTWKARRYTAIQLDLGGSRGKLHNRGRVSGSDQGSRKLTLPRCLLHFQD